MARRACQTIRPEVGPESGQGRTERDRANKSTPGCKENTIAYRTVTGHKGVAIRMLLAGLKRANFDRQALQKYQTESELGGVALSRDNFRDFPIFRAAK
jgi:RecB family exonuclease